MKRFLFFLSAIMLLTSFAGGSALTRDELRQSYRLAVHLNEDVPLFETEPSVSELTAGTLGEAPRARALCFLNFLRSVAALDPVGEDALYDLRCANAALLLAANDLLTHEPAITDGMNEELYASALSGARGSNIIRFNWNGTDDLIDALLYFARDDGDINLTSLPHRRWLLDPMMSDTGFGLAVSESGTSYAAMYAVDHSKTEIRWDHICWPSEGCFPADLMRFTLPWSVSLNDDIYDISASEPEITLTETNSGLSFTFSATHADGEFAVSTEPYGSGPCLIFRPDAALFTLNGYEQNQLWHTEIRGLRLHGGSQATIKFDTVMVSLMAIDPVSLELDPLEAELSAGETLQLHASVIPVYADDLSVTWRSSDPEIALVNENGTVTAVAPGSCSIIGETCNGRSDSCTINVKQ